ncbi:MAG: class IV adenylate cyclase [Holophagae bacterium]|jgi:predicted adenylyl cyclase CyaB
MPRNVEIKARLRDRETVEKIVRSLADHGPELIVQEDVFFFCENGRLKLRSFVDGRGELIFYRRRDAAGPASSDFVKVATDHPVALRELLAAALGISGTVRKRRTLYLIGQTRVHLDEVEGLGDWIELEVVLRADQSPDEGARIADALMSDLRLRESDLVAEAYVDLLNS